MEKDKVIELYRSELWECQLLESMLKDAGIACFQRNNKLSGYCPIIMPAQLVQIMICESDLERATAVVRDFKFTAQVEG